MEENKKHAEFQATLLGAQCVEESLAACCDHVAERIHNGRVRQHLREFVRGSQDAA